MYKTAVQRIIDEPWVFYRFVWSWCLTSEFGDEKNYMEMSHIFAFLKSYVSCQVLAAALRQNSTLTDLNLQRNNIGPEGAKAWCLVRMVWWGERVWRNAKEERMKQFGRRSPLKVALGKCWEAMQCSIDWFSDVPNISKYIFGNCDALSGWNLWWHLIAVLVRFWMEKTHQVYLEIKSFPI